MIQGAESIVFVGLFTMYHRRDRGCWRVSTGDNNTWRARWTAFLLISPSFAPPYLYWVLYRQTKKHHDIDPSFNRHLFRLLIKLPPYLSQSPLPSNYSCTNHRLVTLVLILPFNLSSILFCNFVFYNSSYLYPWCWLTVFWCFESCSFAGLCFKDSVDEWPGNFYFLVLLKKGTCQVGR